MDNGIWLLGLESALKKRTNESMAVPQSSLHCLSLQLSFHGHSSPPDTSPPLMRLKYYIYALHMLLFYVTNISIINPKMPLIFNQALKFIPIESALNNSKRVIQVKEHWGIPMGTKINNLYRQEKRSQLGCDLFDKPTVREDTLPVQLVNWKSRCHVVMNCKQPPWGGDIDRD